MGTEARKVLEAACSLDQKDRALVAAELSADTQDDPEEVRKAWVKVAVERLERYEQDGEAETLSIEELEAELLARHRQR